jgi:hypothetical protein
MLYERLECREVVGNGQYPKPFTERLRHVFIIMADNRVILRLSVDIALRECSVV